ncbi:MAG TPA: hypothetical protein VFU81_01810 [Thermomicrobiales bacterium]|nr:hypothetical protein [Thermomicrobiales bacterium]
MDDHRFDDLARSIGGESRRRLLAVGVALAAAAVGLAFAADDDAALAGTLCKPPGAPCGRDRQCCAKRCKNRKCGCKPRGAPCFQLGIVCCSQRCKRGKCG